MKAPRTSLRIAAIVAIAGCLFFALWAKAQEKENSAASKPNPAQASATPKASPAPPVSPTKYPIVEADAAEFANLRQAQQQAAQVFSAGVTKLINAKFECQPVLEAAGQLKDANLNAMAAQQRLEAWFFSHRPKDCEDCLISADGKSWERPAKR